MIQNIRKGTGFRGVLNYTLEKDGAEIIGGNMYGETPRALAAEFRSFRELRPEVERAVFHASLAAPHGEQLDNPQWAAIADEYAERMGFGQSPYVVIRHHDTEHEHVHVVASRVDVGGRVVSQEWDHYRGQDVLRGIERAHGLEQVASSWESPSRQLTRPDIERLKDGHQPYAEEIRGVALPAIRGAQSWDDLRGRLERHGLRVEPKRGGLVVTDGTNQCKASDVGRECSRGQLDQRFGVTYAEWRAERAGRAERDGPATPPERGRAGAAEPERGPTAERGTLSPSSDRAPERGGPAGRADSGDRAREGGGARPHDGGRAGGGGRAGADGVGPLRGEHAGVDAPREGRIGGPSEARDRSRAARDGRADARGAGDERGPRRPDAGAEHGGVPGRGAGAAGAHGTPGVAADDVGHGSPRRDRGGADRALSDAGAPELGAARVSAATVELRAKVAEYEARRALEQRHGAALTRAASAAAHARGQERAQERADEAGRAFGTAVGAVYRDPTAARVAIEQAAERAGVGPTVDAMRHTPEAFGELRGGVVLGMQNAERRTAAGHAGELATRAGEHFGALSTFRDMASAAFAPAQDGAAARAEAAEAARRLHDFVQHHEMLNRMEQIMGELGPTERAAAREGLTTSERAVVDQATERSAERNRGFDRGWER